MNILMVKEVFVYIYKHVEKYNLIYKMSKNYRIKKEELKWD